MANTVIALKKSATPSSVPVDLANGELAINYADGKLYYKAANGTIASISGNEPNYFGTVNANNTLVVADTPGDIFTIAAGKNIDIVGDAINDKLTVRLTDDVAISGLLSVTASSGDEGGEIRLANAVTNSLLAGPVNIDIYQNQLRFFVSGGDARGAFINLAATSAGVGTDLLASSSGTDTVARATAGQAFDKANAALPNVSGAWFNGTLTASQNLVADKIISTNNGNGENFKIGDDVWIGDFNVANSLRIKGQQNASIAYINFGVDDTKTLGRSGTGPLTYDGNTIWHAGNDGTGTGLDADLLDGQHGSYYGIASDVTGAFTQANTARTHANAAFLAANNAVTDFSPAFNQANLAYAQANAAYNAANNAVTDFSPAFIQANTARDHANAAFLSSNAVNTYSDSTYVKLSASSQTITGDLDIVGNLTLSGNTFSIDATRLEVDDPLLYLAANNYTSDIVDIGFIANYVNATGQNVHTGLYREHENKEYYLFQGYDKEPINNHIGALSNNMTLAVLNADIKTSNLILGGANAIVTIGQAFNTANDANSTATNALPNTSGISFNGNLNFPTGNIGISTTITPGRLTVLQDRSFYPYAQVIRGYNGTSFENDWIMGWNGTASFLGNFQANPIDFRSNNVIRIRIDANGEVGIGTTNPGYILDVKGIANVSSALLVNDMNVKPTIESSFEQANTARDSANNALANVTTRATYSGNLDFTAGGISFGSRVSSASTNVMNHIALWSTTFGFSITEQNLNAVVPATSNVTILVGGTQRARVNSNGMWVEGGINATSMIKSTQLFANDMDVEPTVVAAFNKANSGGSIVVTTDTLNATRYIVFDDSTTGTFANANVSTALTYNPSTGTLSSTLFNSTSDMNKKDNIVVISDALDIIQEINGVKFNWKTNGEPSVGVIAQDVEKVLPELVGEDKSVNYNGLIGVLIEAVKELKAEIDVLKNSK